MESFQHESNFFRRPLILGFKLPSVWCLEMVSLLGVVTRDGMEMVSGGHVTRVLEVGTCSAGDDVMTHSELSHDASSSSPRSLQSIVLLFNTFLPKLFLNSCTKDPFIVDLRFIIMIFPFTIMYSIKRDRGNSNLGQGVSAVS